jgi:AmmeMemoRadiSam system protein B/AmmeMemoRadiSam system protein A
VIALARRFPSSLLVGLFCLLAWGSPVKSAAPGSIGQTGSVRPAALAGSWYPGDPQTLRAKVDTLLDATEMPPDLAPEKIVALVVPHAGMVYSGATAASAFRLVKGQSYDRVVVLAPSHRVPFSGLAVPSVDAFETPLGRIPLDKPAISLLLQSDLVKVVPGVHAAEHSIEMELPFLQRALAPGWKLVPVLVGRMEKADYAVAAEVMRSLTQNHTLVVASSDFTHFGDSYGYKPFPVDHQTPERLRDLDMGLFVRMKAFDTDAMLAYKERTGITACGFGPIMVLTQLLKGQAEPRLISYTTSGRLTGDFRRSVSYLAVAYLSDGSPGAGAAYTPEELKTLHRLARDALKLAVQEGVDAVDADRLAEGLPLTDKMRAPGAAFVTLRRDGQLRGCIGDLVPMRPLYASVADNAVNAALKDHRFNPVRPEELPGMDVEISLLTAPVLIPSYSDYDIARHGIILVANGHRAVYLPEVAPRMAWNRDYTLTRLSLKAGLRPDAWRQSDAKFAVFYSVTYEGPFDGQGVDVAGGP